MSGFAAAAGQKPALTPVQALSQLTAMITGYASTQALATGCKLGIFEELSKGALTPEDLAARKGIHPVGCRRLLNALASLNLLEREGQAYRNSELGSYCSSAAPVNLSAIQGFAEPFYHMFEYLPDALREYSPRWHQALGTSKEDVFGALYEDPARLRQFAAFMNAMSIPQGQLIAESFDFTPYRCIMDVAGGPGGQAIEIGRRHTHLRGIITDMAGVCEIAAENIRGAGLEDRFSAIPADLFEGPYPKGADVILLGHILHDWNDDHCRRILANCSAALPSGGCLLISESVLNPDHSGLPSATLKDLAMLVVCESGGRERSEPEYAELLHEADFEVVRMMRLNAPRDLLIAQKR